MIGRLPEGSQVHDVEVQVLGKAVADRDDVALQLLPSGWSSEGGV